MPALRRFVTFALAALCAASAFSVSAMDEPPSRWIPGKYFEYRAQFYLKNKDYRAALDMFQMAGYWANKIAQYNAGIMYFNGIGGVPVDKVRGVAWLGIAAEQHADVADAALQSAYTALTPEQRQEAGRVFRTLDVEYGDDVTLRRALNRYEDERRNVTGSHLGLVSNMTIFLPDGSFQSGNSYYADSKKEFDNYVDTSFGHVSVGDLKPLDVPAEAKANASTARLHTSPPPPAAQPAIDQHR